MIIFENNMGIGFMENHHHQSRSTLPKIIDHRQILIALLGRAGVPQNL
jgi:hypothetical protein